MFQVMRDYFQDKKVKVLEDRLQAGLSDDEREFFQASELGNYDVVKELIESDKVKIDSVDQLGRTGLEMAVCGDDPRVVAYLLERTSSKNIHKALIAAADNDMDNMCELLLDHPMYQESVKRQLEKQASSPEGEEKKSDLTCDNLKLLLMEVMIRAAKRNNFQIVKKILVCGVFLDMPHDYFCNCHECRVARAEDFKVFTQRRLDTFAALASPAYICLTSEDPVSQAFNLSSKFRQLAETEGEYKGIYNALDQQVQDFSTEVLDMCQSSDEVKSVLKGKHKNPDSFESDDDEDNEDDGGLPLVITAVGLEQKKFVAHPQCQAQVGQLWFSGVPALRYLNKFLYLMMAIPIGCVLCPLLSLIYIFLPWSSLLDKLTTLMTTPLMKFLSFTCSYITFLGLCVYAKLNMRSYFDSFSCETPELRAYIVVVIIFLYISGFIFEECLQIYETGAADYMASFWNMIDSIMLSLLCASFTLDVVAPIMFSKANVPRGEASNTAHYHMMVCNKSQHEDQMSLESFCSLKKTELPYEIKWEPEWVPDPQLMADVMFSIGILLSVSRFSFIMPVNEALGTMLVSFRRCLSDVTKTVGMFVLIILAFACAISSMYAPNTCLTEKFMDFRTSLQTLCWAMLGYGEADDPGFQDNSETWSVYSLTNKHQRAESAEIAGKVLYAVYSFGMVVVLLNLLIAIMSTSYEEIEGEKDMEWKFARTELWLTFIGDDGPVAPPFNIIPQPRYIWTLLKECCICICCFCCRKKKSEDDEDEENEGSVDCEIKQSRQEIMGILIRRYVVYSERKKTEGDDGEKLNGEEMLKRQLDKLGVKMERRIDDMVKKFSKMDHDLAIMKRGLSGTQHLERDHVDKFTSYVEKNTDEVCNLHGNVSVLSKGVDGVKTETRLVQQQGREHLDKFVEFAELKSGELGEYGNMLKGAKEQINDHIDTSAVKIDKFLDNRVCSLNTKLDTSVKNLAEQVEKMSGILFKLKDELDEFVNQCKTS